MNAGASKSLVGALNCTQCGGPLKLAAPGYSVSLICPFCGSTLDATTPELKLIRAAEEALSRPKIRLGRRALLNGVDWEVIGYLQRSDGSTRWSEYLLFNPYHGYRFLVDDGRRWSLGQVLDRVPPRGFAGHRSLDGRSHASFGPPYVATVTEVVGEFYWRVAVGESVMVRDFVRPGTLISHEVGETEETWSRLDMLDKGVVETAFQLDPRSSFGRPPSPHEPSPYQAPLLLALAVAAAALFAMVVISAFGSPAQSLFVTAVAPRLDGPEQTVTVGPVVLPHATNRVVVEASGADLRNSWIDMDVSLVERETQESYDGYVLAEHYEGRDSDGRWSEGDGSGKLSFSKVPKGRYDVVLDVASHRWSGDSSSTPASFATETFGEETQPTLTVMAQRGGVDGGAFGLAFLAIAAWPLLLGLLNYDFHRRRRSVLDSEAGE